MKAVDLTKVGEVMLTREASTVRVRQLYRAVAGGGMAAFRVQFEQFLDEEATVSIWRLGTEWQPLWIGRHEAAPVGDEGAVALEAFERVRPILELLAQATCCPPPGDGFPSGLVTELEVRP